MTRDHTNILILPANILILPILTYATFTGTSYTGFTFTLPLNATTMLAVGDRVLFVLPASNTGVSYATAGLPLTTPTYISAITVTSATTTTITVRDKIVATTASFTVNIGTMRRSKVALAGRVSIVPAAQVVLATPGSSQIRLSLITASQVVPKAKLFLQGKAYNVSSAALCGDSTTNYCVTLSTNYTGVAVAAASTSVVGATATYLPAVYAFPSNVTVYTSVSPVGSLTVGDLVWVGEEELTVIAVATQSFSVSGKAARYGYEGATAFRSGKGYERAILFKATNPTALKVNHYNIVSFSYHIASYCIITYRIVKHHITTTPHHGHNLLHHSLSRTSSRRVCVRCA